MTKIIIPSEKRAKKPVCPAGDYTATVTDVDVGDEEDEYIVNFYVPVNGNAHTIRQTMSGPELADICVDLPIGVGDEEEVELKDVRGDLRVKVRTFGGKTSAKVVETSPI